MAARSLYHLLLARAVALLAAGGPISPGSAVRNVVGGSIASCISDNDAFLQTAKGYAEFNQDQDFELAFHLDNEWRKSPDFARQCAQLFEGWNLHPRAFEGEVVVDMGAGSRLRSAYFENARLVAIEPMAERLLPHVAAKPHMDIGDPSKVWQLYSMPAEVRACAVEGLASLVIVVNVLDHVWKPERALQNAERLLRPCSAGPALLVVSTDLRVEAALGHPNVLTRRWFREQAHANHSKLQLVRAFQQHVQVEGALRFSWDWNFDDGRSNVAWTFVFRRRCGNGDQAAA
mmetsp:Transcript_39656/g.127097  ORF Transcript_39656/g.127097 Transcript_39656/m.127097 type:complete len:289 (+) Transcript_39656:83-949(+)